MTDTTEYRNDITCLFYVTSVCFSLFALILLFFEDPNVSFFWFISLGSFAMGTCSAAYNYLSRGKTNYKHSR